MSFEQWEEWRKQRIEELIRYLEEADLEDPSIIVQVRQRGALRELEFLARDNHGLG